ncbi:hypothetical protein PLICRDRAFT_52485 [Plicaturopsis crispa FD-325 SS-3]|nr:hypothetical protein PLICRDRAFT_52485 [Plicaturopsis crispa FD-325 SS-3]
MAEAPIAFKRTKSKPVLRARAKSPDSNESTDAPGGEDSPSTLATKLKSKVKRAKAKSRLSFGGEDEGEEEVFQVKKSNLSRKLALGKHPASPGSLLPGSLDQASISPRANAGPTYDKAYLSELKASTPSSRPPPPRDDSFDIDMSVDDISFQSNDVFESETAIPSESSIINAKQKRERLRGSGREEDFISLSVARRPDESQGPHPNSRLVREDDELGEAEEEFAEYTSAQERIALGKKSKKVEAIKRRDAMKDMIADADEEDDETMEWESEQLRRGGHTASDFVEKPPVKKIYKAAPIPPSTTIPTLGHAIGRLTHSMTSLTTSHAKNTSAMSSLSEERAQLDARETEMRAMINRAEAKRSWFVAFREWVESVATFLDEKFPQLEKLEDDHLSILKERAEMIAARRKGDDEDDLSIFLGSLPVEAQHDGDDVDEMGRAAPRSNPLAARRDRRRARQARRKPTNADEGYSTDSSLPPSDAADYKTAIGRLSADAAAVISDVRAEEFRNPSAGLGKWFDEWRQRFGESYTGAWGGLGLVGAWEFWVRLEILGWNPLEDSRTLDSFSWYSSLHEYSRPRVDDDGEPELGPDGDLVSAMISTAIVPRLCKLIEGGAFNPYSSKDIRGVLDLAEQVEASVEKDNIKFQMLLKSVYVCFEQAVSATESSTTLYLSLNQPLFDPEAIPARQRFLTKRIKLLENAVRWRKYSGERFGIGALCTRLVAGVIVPVARSGWEVGGEECARRVQTILPQELAPNFIQRL